MTCPFVHGGTENEGYVAYGKLQEALHTFKFPDFQPGQLQALLPLQHGKDVL